MSVCIIISVFLVSISLYPCAATVYLLYLALAYLVLPEPKSARWSLSTVLRFLSRRTMKSCLWGAFVKVFCRRLRWSNGRFSIARTFGLRLFSEGIRQRNLRQIDASLPLIFPNFSLQVNLTAVTLVLALLLPSSVMKDIFVVAALSLIAGQLLRFLAGIFIAGSACKDISGSLLRTGIPGVEIGNRYPVSHQALPGRQVGSHQKTAAAAHSSRSMNNRVSGW